MQPNNFLSEEQKQQAGKAADSLMEKVFLRIAHVLTEEDMQTIEQLDKDDQNGNAVKYFLISKVPNFEAIIEEEILFLSQAPRGS